MKLYRFLILLTIMAGHVCAQDARRVYLNDAQWAQRERQLDFKTMKLELKFEPKLSLVKGVVTHTATVLRNHLDSIWFDGINMSNVTVSVNGQPGNTITYKNGITVKPAGGLKWNQDITVVINYTCNPRKGLYFIGWNDSMNLSRKQIWSQGQGIDNRYWIPMYDEMNDKIVSEMIVSFDTEYKVLSNGVLISEKEKDGIKTWHYKMSKPHAPYLIMLGIGRYDVQVRKSKSGVPVNLYFYPEWEDRIEVTYERSEDMIDFFENEFGVRYPWETYSQIPVQDFMYGAMENTTATVFGDFLMTDKKGFNDRAYIGVNAHELMHQWFGDYVTARSAAHHWLQESFATYGNWMYEREFYGNDYFEWQKRNAQNAALNESKKNKLPVAHSEAGSVRHYPKGAFVLDMLKMISGGREVYNKCINHYLNQHPYGNADTRDLQLAFEHVTGMSLTWFFEQWVYKGGEPEYKVSYRNENNRVVFSVRQVQPLSETTGLPASSDALASGNTGGFIGAASNVNYRPAGLWKMPFVFEVHYTDGTSSSETYVLDDVYQEVVINNPNSKEVAYVLFDPGNRVLKKVQFDKPIDMLKIQAKEAPQMLDRYDAVAALKSIAIDQKREVLTSLYYSENSKYVKAEIVNQLNGDKHEKSLMVIKDVIANGPVYVQKQLVENTPVIMPELYSDFEKLLNGNSYELMAAVLEKLCTQNPVSGNQYLGKTKDITGCTGMLVRIKWLELNVANDKKGLEELVSLSGISYEFRTRINAIEALRNLNFFNQRLAHSLIDGSCNPNRKLASVAGEALKYFNQQKANRQIISDAVNGIPSWQQEIVNGFLK